MLSSTYRARNQFIRDKIAMIREVKSGEVKINPNYGVEKYINKCLSDMRDYRLGLHDDSLYFQQVKHYLETGVTLPMLPN